MPVASRFPIKPFPVLWLFIIVFHFSLVAIGLVGIGVNWKSGLVLLVSTVSLYVSWLQYKKVSSASDDLCWTGESWVMSLGGKLNAKIYLEVQPSSWLSSLMSVLYFTSGNKKYAWLFTRSGLGARAYSELCYLVKQDLQAQRKNEQPFK